MVLGGLCYRGPGVGGVHPVDGENAMIPGVRWKFPSGDVVEITHYEGCYGTPEEWVVLHLKREGTATKERFESEIPVHRHIYPDGTVKDDLKKGD